MSSTIFTDPDDTIEKRHEQRRQAARKRWPEYPAGDLDNRSGYIIDRGSGLLFRPVHHVVFARGVEVDTERADIAGFDNSGSDAPLLRAHRRTPAPLPNSRRRKRHARRQEREREQAHADFIATQPLRTVTLAELRGRPDQRADRLRSRPSASSTSSAVDSRPTAPTYVVLRPLTPRRRPQRRPHRPAMTARCRESSASSRAGRNTILSELAKDSKTPTRRPAARPARRRGRRAGMSDTGGR